MTRFLMVGMVAGMLLLTACNDANKKSSTMTTDDTSYPVTKSDSSNTYTPSNTTYTPSNTNSSSSGTTMTHQPIYTTTTVTPGTGDTSGSSGYSSTPSGSYTTSSSSPPTTTVISPAGGNTEMSDESLSPSGSSRSKSRSGGGQTYTVKSGDSLSKISKKMYGDAGKWNKIYNANKTKISNPNQLKVGTKLVIP